MPKTSEINSTFADNGYFLAKSVFSGDQLNKLTHAFDQVANQLSGDLVQNNARWQGDQVDAIDGGESLILHTHNIQSYSANWMQALMDDRFLDSAESILGPDIVLHHSNSSSNPLG